MKACISIVLTISLLVFSYPLPAQQGAPEPPSRPYLAVMEISMDGEYPENLGTALTDKIRTTLVGTGQYILIDRATVEVILGEMAPERKGCFITRCAVDAGRQLSANLIIIGRVTKLGPNECQLSIQMIDVARSEIARAATETGVCDIKSLSAAAESVAFDIAGIPRQPGNVVLNSNPSGGIVYIDGERVGSTPFNSKLKPGQHKIIVTARGYELSEETIAVNPGESISRSYTLKKAKKKWYQAWWFYTAAGVILAGGLAGAFAAGSGGGGGGGSAATPAPTGHVVIDSGAP